MRLWEAGRNAPLSNAALAGFWRVWGCYCFDSRALRYEYERLHLVATMAARRHPLRSHIVTLFRRGDLVSVREAVLICDASRQAISKWLRLAGIKRENTRMAYIARQRRRAQLIAEGKLQRRRPTKTEMREEIARARSSLMPQETMPTHSGLLGSLT
jgi:hypothetical protein